MHKNSNGFNRREMLKLSACATALGVTSFMLPMSAFATGTVSGRALILLKLNGGNDGFNTIVPVSGWKGVSAATAGSDYAIYQQYRPKIALDPTTLVGRDAHYGFHPALAALMPAWSAGDMAVALGVGYPGPGSTTAVTQPMIDSHFAGSDMWDTAYVASTDTPGVGWLANLLNKSPSMGNPSIQAALLGNIPPGPLLSNLKSAVVTPRIALTSSTQISDALSNNGVYAAAYSVQHELDQAALAIDQYSADMPPGNLSGLGASLFYVAQLIAGFTNKKGQAIQGLGIPVFVIEMGSYDMHQNQLAVQQPLLLDFANSIAYFRNLMIQNGQWNNVMLMTYAEFGRTLTQNSALGTDHGQSNNHFILGGNIKGGYIGQQRALNTVSSNGLLIYTLDFRSLYSTAINFLGGSTSVSNSVLGGNFTPLNIFKA